jgi:sarcosine oxidase subunit gamma
VTADLSLADPDPSTSREPEPGSGAATAHLRRSPLAHRAADLEAAGSDRITLTELPFLTMVNLRVNPDSATAPRIEAALGARLPGAGGATGTTGGRSLLWLGPDEWLVIGPDGDAGALIAQLEQALAGQPGSCIDVSANRATLVLAGPAARDLLEKGCTLDLHPRAFTAGQCAQTTFARGHLLIWQVEAEDSPAGPVYRLLLRPSFCDYFADWLTDAATEFRS